MSDKASKKRGEVGPDEPKAERIETNLLISKEHLDKIQKFVKDKRFESLNDFVDQALNLLIYAEDRKEDFEKILSM